MNDRIVLPGSTIGVLGSGQLGRMFAIAARRVGYRVHVLSPDSDTPTGQVADVEVNAPYDDLDQVAQFARQVQAVTFEFENVPVQTAEVAARFAPVRPAGQVLHTTQNRLREKSFLRDAGFPVTPFHAVRSAEELNAAIAAVGLPAVLKTADWGYDGKGQFKVATKQEAAAAWLEMGQSDAVLEKLIEFESEMSVIAVRGIDGQMVHYQPFTNFHRNHILDVTTTPASVPDRVAAKSIEIARGVLAELNVVGVMCVEFFVTPDGQLLINELAPRPHNSGHLTIDAHVTCQFEQQVRSVCGLPLGSTELLRPAAMANLLGDLWSAGEPDWIAACKLPEVKLHLYGKAVARPGRKMGHLTALADSTQRADELVQRARAALAGGE